MFGGNEGALLGVFGHINFVGEDLPVPSQGCCVHLGAWVNVDTHSHHPILCAECQVGAEGDMSI